MPELGSLPPQGTGSHLVLWKSKLAKERASGVFIFFVDKDIIFCEPIVIGWGVGAVTELRYQAAEKQKW